MRFHAVAAALLAALFAAGCGGPKDAATEGPSVSSKAAVDNMKVFFDTGDFRNCVFRGQALIKHESQDDSTNRLYLGLCYVALKKYGEALTALRPDVVKYPNAKRSIRVRSVILQAEALQSGKKPLDNESATSLARAAATAEDESRSAARDQANLGLVKSAPADAALCITTARHQASVMAADAPSMRDTFARTFEQQCRAERWSQARAGCVLDAGSAKEIELCRNVKGLTTKDHTRLAKKAYAAKKYAKCAAHYMASHELEASPGKIFNVGLCREMDGKMRGAIRAYSKYLTAAPNGEKANEAKMRVELLQFKVKEAEAR